LKQFRRDGKIQDAKAVNIIVNILSNGQILQVSDQVRMAEQIPSMLDGCDYVAETREFILEAQLYLSRILLNV
jgi:hypothetical protein